MRVRYGTYESNEEMLAKVVTGNSGWDVVFPTHSRIEPMARHGLIAELDRRRLPSLVNLEARFQRPVWDPGLRWGVPYMWNGTGIVYNRRQAREPAGWAGLWAPELAGRMTMLDDPEDVLGACLQKLGFPFSSSDEGQLRAAAQEAAAQKKLLRAYINAEVRDQLVAGDVLAAQLWSTTAAQAMRANGDLDFVYPAEGFPLYCDCAVLLRESRRSELGHEFLEFLLRPDVARANAKYSDTATVNQSGEWSNPRNSVLYPTGKIYNTGVWVSSVTREAQKLRDRLWTEIKAG